MNNWLYENFMILDPGKSHYTYLEKNLDKNEVLNFNNLTIRTGKNFKHRIDNNLRFNNQIKSIKAGQKFLKVSCKLNVKQKQLLYKSVIKSRFNYCP